MFDVIDTGKEGTITGRGEGIFNDKVIAPEMSETEIMHAFELLDTAKDGKISCEEFTATTEDFQLGVEETDVSKLFFGPLLD